MQHPFHSDHSPMELTFEHAGATWAFTQKLVFIKSDFPFVGAEIERAALGSDGLNLITFCLANLSTLPTTSGDLLIILQREQVRVLFFGPIRLLRSYRNIAPDAHLISRSTTAMLGTVIRPMSNLGWSSFFILLLRSVNRTAWKVRFCLLDVDKCVISKLRNSMQGLPPILSFDEHFEPKRTHQNKQY